MYDLRSILPKPGRLVGMLASEGSSAPINASAPSANARFFRKFDYVVLALVGVLVPPEVVHERRDSYEKSGDGGCAAFGLDAEQQAGAADDEGNPCCRHGKFRSGYSFGLRIGSYLPTLHQVLDAAIKEESAEETGGRSGTEALLLIEIGDSIGVKYWRLAGIRIAALGSLRGAAIQATAGFRGIAKVQRNRQDCDNHLTKCVHVPAYHLCAG